MKLIVCFSDFDADVIDVPRFVIDQIEVIRDRFDEWLYNEENDHDFWEYRKGKKYAVCFRSDAFVFWLNEFHLKNSEERAEILEEFVDEYDKELPSIWF